MIHYNNPDRAEERQNVKPLSVDQMAHIVEILNSVAQYGLHSSGFPDYYINKLQRLIDHYENLQHFYDAVGGWEAHSAMKELLVQQEETLKKYEKAIPVWHTNKPYTIDEKWWSLKNPNWVDASKFVPSRDHYICRVNASKYSSLIRPNICTWNGVKWVDSKGRDVEIQAWDRMYLDDGILKEVEQPLPEPPKTK